MDVVILVYIIYKTIFFFFLLLNIKDGCTLHLLAGQGLYLLYKSIFKEWLLDK